MGQSSWSSHNHVICAIFAVDDSGGWLVCSLKSYLVYRFCTAYECYALFSSPCSPKSSTLLFYSAHMGKARVERLIGKTDALENKGCLHISNARTTKMSVGQVSHHAPCSFGSVHSLAVAATSAKIAVVDFRLPATRRFLDPTTSRSFYSFKRGLTRQLSAPVIDITPP